MLGVSGRLLTVGASPPTVTHIATGVIPLNAAGAGRVNSIPIGAPSADRVVIFTIYGTRSTISGSIGTFSVNGQTTPIIVQQTASGSTSLVVGVACMLLPAGDTANIQIGFTGSMDSAVLRVSTLTGVANPTPHSFVRTTSNPASLSLGATEGANVFFAAAIRSTSTQPEWTGVEALAGGSLSTRAISAAARVHPNPSNPYPITTSSGVGATVALAWS